MKATDFYAGGWFAFFLNFSFTKAQCCQKSKSRHATTFLREDTTLIFENLHTNNQHPLDTSMARQEDHSRWYYSHPLQNSRVRLWTLFTCEKVALKSRLSPKCARNVFWNQSWFQRWLDNKVKFHESNKSQGCFISVSESPCSNYPPPIVVEILHKQKPHV